MYAFLLLSVVPGIEARGAAFLLLCSNMWFLVPLTVLLNFAAVFVFIKILDASKLPNRIENFLEKRIRKHMKMVENWFQKYGNYALFLLIALPSNGVGSFSGAFIGRVFGLRGKLFYMMIIFAIALSVLPALLVAYGFSMFSVFGLECNL